MNFKVIKVAPRNDETFHEPCCKSNHFIKTEAFTVLPPFSPQIPGPPPTPNPYRILPPIVSRKNPSFVILQEVGSRPVSREPSPSGRVSPFRGCGFKPPSRETSPSRAPPEDEASDKSRRSRSRLPVAVCKASTRKMSKSVSPVSHKTSGIPRPLNRRISYSPNRATEILAQINSTQLKCKTLKSSENLHCRRPVSESNLKECGKCPGELRTSISNLHCQKPPIPQKSKPALCGSRTKINSHESTPTKLRTIQPTKCQQLKKSRDDLNDCTRLIPVSPVRAAKYEPTRKSRENLTDPGRRMPMSPVRARNTATPKSPSKNISAKFKENQSPTSKIPSPARTRTPVKTPKSPARIPRSPSKSPVPTRFVNKSSPSKPEMKSPAKESPNSTPTTPIEKEIPAPSPASSQPAELELKHERPEKFNSVRTVGRKALTTSNLLSAIKRKNIVEKKVDEKKELPHTDTSRSLPISIGGSGMTESSVTLIRTTTEPALAPVQLELISEIRSAINDVRNNDETQSIKSETLNLSSDQTAKPMGPVSMEAAAENISEQNQMPETSMPKSTDTPASTPKTDRKNATHSSPRNSPRGSPRPTHVVAVTQIEEPKTELTSHMGKTQSEMEDAKLTSSDSSMRSGDRNGISKSLWLNENLPTAATMKKPISMSKLKEQQLGWKKFKGQSFKRGFATETYPVQVSTITKASSSAAVATKKSCCKKFFCYFCYKCRLKRRPSMVGIHDGSPKKTLSCPRCRKGFKNLFAKLSCRRKKTLTGSEVAGTRSPSSDGGCCGRCTNRVYKCISILCCWNSAICLKLRSRCGKWCSCCRKYCSCCAAKKKTVITESERRKSTISNTRKRKWTRVFTDFPKLDASFVDHSSVMRGAIPVLPVPLAWICLILNVFLPGFGTLFSGIFCLFVGKPRFSINDSLASRFGSLLVNLLVAGSQLFTVLFCLVGWGWSIWWGVIMLRMAKKNKRIIMAEQGGVHENPASTVKPNRDVEKGAAT